MMQIVAFILVLAAIYAVKTISIMKQHGELADMASSFSWAHARQQDSETAAAWSQEEPVKERVTVSYRTIAHA